jgi:hypothetical protein
MKIATIALATTLIGSTAIAEDGLHFGGEVVTEYNMSTSVLTSVVTPTVGYTIGDADFTASSDLALWDDGSVVGDTLDVLPTIDFRADYTVNDSLELYGEVSYDLEAESRGDVVVGASFNF